MLPTSPLHAFWIWLNRPSPVNMSRAAIIRARVWFWIKILIAAAVLFWALSDPLFPKVTDGEMPEGPAIWNTH